MASTSELTLASCSGPSTGATAMQEHPAWPMLSRLPVVLAVSIPIDGFRVRHLLDLRKGETIETRWSAIRDVPLQVGDVHLGWGQFEVVEQQMALRLTRLA